MMLDNHEPDLKKRELEEQIEYKDEVIDRLRQELAEAKSRYSMVYHSSRYQMGCKLARIKSRPYLAFSLLFKRDAKKHPIVPKSDTKVDTYVTDTLFRSLERECNIKKVESFNRGDAEFFLCNREDVDPLLVKAYHEAGISTVFWDTERSLNGAAAGLFDYVYALTDEDAKTYQDLLKRDGICMMGPAVQPRKASPYLSQELTRYEKNRLCIVTESAPGIYEKAAARFGADYYKPESLGPGLYCRYDAIAIEEPTAFNILEALSCGAAVICPKAPEGFCEYVCEASDPEGLETFLNKILTDEDERLKIQLKALRHVYNGNTYAHRLNTWMKSIGKAGEDQPKGISVVMATNRQSQMEQVFKSYVSQSHPVKQLIIVLNGEDVVEERWREYAENYPGEEIEILNMGVGVTLGPCLNAGYERAKYEYLAKMDDDDYYGPNYLSDMLMCFDFCGADIVGKKSFYVYFESYDQLALKWQGNEYKKVDAVSGATLVFKRKVFEKVRFGGLKRGSDTAFLKACVENGFEIYSGDRYNFILHRSAQTQSHTWTISDEEHRKKCMVVKNFKDYKYVTV